MGAYKTTPTTITTTTITGKKFEIKENFQKRVYVLYYIFYLISYICISICIFYIFCYSSDLSVSDFLNQKDFSLNKEQEKKY